MSSIDIVIRWVDDSDQEWIKEKNHYAGIYSDGITDSSNTRYRDWDTLIYLFRGIEKFASWINKIHLVTWGHTPKWLNTQHPKVNIVKHRDFIPEEYLPTFSSRTIDFNLHRISGLQEQFILFDDDELILRRLPESDFFVNGLPKDSAILSPFRISKGGTFLAPLVNASIINDHFDIRKEILRNPTKWFNYRYGINNVRTLLMMPYPNLYGMMQSHLPVSYNKTTFYDVWNAEYDLLDSVCRKRFRDNLDPNQWLMEMWQIARGNFVPRKATFGQAFYLTDLETAKLAAEYISKQKGKLICINDSDSIGTDIEEAKSMVKKALNSIFPEKSSFEI